MTAESVKELRAFSLLRLMFPSGLQVALLLLALMVTLVSERVLCPTPTLLHIAMHVAVGVIAFIGVLGVTMWEEKSTVAMFSGTGFGRILDRLYHLLPF
ncbi:unnamed protein product [Hydatigera taeniaeformis]|uniref:Uncharacterized protein n=1 Tax=Hydatigena taeniaeformis TaxID=6205 RepID=A0A3P7F4Y9_HYDTA|nr:unnamed protein product [Hydatigera taeniaeformis]